MAFVNNNNFVQWGDVVVLNPGMIATVSGITDNWRHDDIAPIGLSDLPWTNVSNEVLVTSISGGDSKGLSQSVRIKKGHRYMINYEIKEDVPVATDFYIFFMSGDTKFQQAATVQITNTANVIHHFEVTADDDYSKVLTSAISTTGNDISAHIQQLRITEVGRCDYALPLLRTDILSIFANVEFDSTVIGFTNLRLGLWLVNQGIYLKGIADLNQNVISGTIYSFYADEWTVPELPPGDYQFFLYNDTDFSGETNIYYWSNIFKYIVSPGQTSFVKYRNSVDTLGYAYGSVPAFFNKFRIDLWTGRPNFNENVRGHDTYDGGFIQVKSDIQKIRNFQTRFFDEAAHEAFFSMLSHSNVLIDDIQYKKTQDSGYEIEWSEDDDNQIGNGAVDLLRVDYSEAIQTC